MTVVQLPYIDSYPKPPYHLLQDGNQVDGYWIPGSTRRRMASAMAHLLHMLTDVEPVDNEKVYIYGID